MSARILAGKEFAGQIKQEVAGEVKELTSKYGKQLSLTVIIVGENPASEVYVRNKHKACEEVGIQSKIIALPATASKEELLAKIDELNDDADVNGILVQLPLPEQIAAYEGEILERINPLKDVDGFHPINVGRLSIGEAGLRPCTPAGCIKMLELAGIDIAGKQAAVIGRSNIVGKPMAQLLLEQNATVTICHSRTHNLPEVVRAADIVVAAVGKAGFVTADMIKEGATVIDVGINRLDNGKLTGDVDFDQVSEVAGAITPVPGGVGLLTVAMLMHNVVEAAKLQLR